jgi:hypothetical protein
MADVATPAPRSPCWESLLSKRIYFGHQSVGYDIIAGAERLIETAPAIRLRIVDSADPEALREPGLVHSKVGSNADPVSKLQAFSNLLAAGAGERSDVAMMKFCYVDIQDRTNVESLFDLYRRTFDDLGRRFPRVRFLHATVPLTSRPGGLKNAIKTLIGRPRWGDENNRRRHLFNEKVRAFWGGALFDIARLQSDDGASSFRIAGTTHPCLNAAYTHDGGHLNETGKTLLGHAFLDALTKVAA